MSDLFSKILEFKKQHKTFCIVTVVDTDGETPRKAGARGLVFPDGSIEGTVGGGSIEVEAIETAKQALKTGKPFLKISTLKDLKDKMICGGSMTLFFEPISPQRRLTIFGGGHVGRAIAPIAKIAGWQVKVVDHRKEVLAPKFFPENIELINANYVEYIKAASFDLNDWLIIVTPKHLFDEEVLMALIHHQTSYIGLMGSAGKIKNVMTNLKSNGISEKLLARVFAPVGLNIGTETPGEIAVAIVAEMLAVLNGTTEVKSCVKSI